MFGLHEFVFDTFSPELSFLDILKHLYLVWFSIYGLFYLLFYVWSPSWVQKFKYNPAYPPSDLVFKEFRRVPESQSCFSQQKLAHF